MLILCLAEFHSEDGGSTFPEMLVHIWTIRHDVAENVTIKILDDGL
jgi:hypothetical protein